MNFAFFDLETTGVSPAFDQPLQFAAILTDAQFREVERVDLRCQIAPHIIPSPHALAVTGLRPTDLVDPNLPTLFEFSQTIADLIGRWSPAIWTGFNSIQFDEEMLRQMFYQNLQADIFATQFNGNTRLDIMTAVFAVWHRRPDLLHWPVDDTGRVRFKLDQLAPQNGFEHHNAHDALGDVEATIHLARLIAQRDPALWQELLEARDKSNIKARFVGFQPVAFISRFGGGPPTAMTVCFCGYGRENSNQAIVFDIGTNNPADWLAADEARLISMMEAAPGSVRTVSINKAPALLALPDPAPELVHRAGLIASAPEFRARLVSAMAQRFPKRETAQVAAVEKRIFEGFYSHADKALLREFQTADWRRRQELVASFSDPRLRQLGRRLVAFYAPELLTQEARQQFAEWQIGRWSAPDSAETEWMTVEKARIAIEELRETGNQAADTFDAIERFVARFE